MTQPILTWIRRAGVLAAAQFLVACTSAFVPLETRAGDATETGEASVQINESPSVDAAVEFGNSDPPESGEISFESSGLILKGILSLPAAAPDSPVGGVVLIHGSGPQSRNASYAGQLNMAFGFEVPVFEQLAEQLVSAGYAVLRYDKRSCGPFNNCADNEYPLPPNEITIAAFVQDVEAAVQFLGAQDKVDASRVFLLGHSQGAKIALDVLERNASVAAAVMLAGNHRPVDSLLEYQVALARSQILAAGLSEAQADQALTPAIALRDQARSARLDQEQPALAFFRSWIALDDRVVAELQQLNRPVLALGGSYDWNVPADDITAWQASFDSVTDNPGHRTQVVPCVTHALNCVSQPEPSRITPSDIGQDLHPPIVEEIIEFLNAQR